MHNSFLMLHAKYGIFDVLLVRVFLLKTIRKLVKERNMYLFTSLILLIIRTNFGYLNFIHIVLLS